MRKKAIFISSLLLILLLGVALCWIFFFDANPPSTFEWSMEVTLSDGYAEPQTSHGNFTIEEDGNYDLSLKYLPKGSSIKSLLEHPETAPAFLTGCVITDEQGRLHYATSGDGFTVDTSMDLTAGTYNLDYYYLANREDYVEFAKTYLCGSAMAENFADNIDFPSLSEAGKGTLNAETWTMEHALSISKSSGQSIPIISMSLSVLAGLCLVVLIIALSTKDSSLRERYDERQELERGHGFKYAFFTMLIYLCTLLCVDSVDLPLAIDTGILYCSGAFLGILVYAVYCIWHESYFALNQNRRSVMTALALIGFVNFLIGMINLLNGSMVENGRVTFRVMNLLCAGMFFVLFLTMLLKKIVSSKASSADDEEEA